MDRGWRVVSLLRGVPAAPVTDQGTDLNPCDLFLFDCAHQPRIDVLLGFPFKLVLTDRPCTGELVVGDDDPLVGLLL